MAVTETTTIRVPRETRDRLMAEARERGQSMSEMLADIARRVELERIYASEREATRRDEQNPEAIAEYALWDETPSDGLD